MSERTLLIDGDILVYRITAASEVPIDWGNDLWTLHSDLGLCKDTLDTEIETYKTKLQADDIVFALSPSRNYRYRIYPQYKSNRRGKRKPITYAPLKEYIHANYKTYERPDIEGDDVLGILATSPVIIKGEKIIISLDKDMKTIPAKLCDMREPLEIIEVTEEEADYHHMLQTLTGDTTDGYPGCPTVGQKKAEKLLQDVPHTYSAMWPVVVKEFAKHGLSEECALVQARLARICRRNDYDFVKKEVILWNPPKEEK